MPPSLAISKSVATLGNTPWLRVDLERIVQAVNTLAKAGA